ncbi:unnamed protein product [Sphagnum balticum]
MKDIMKGLAQMKKDNSKTNLQLTPLTEVNQRKKKIKKGEKDSKYLHRKEEESRNPDEPAVEEIAIIQKKVNIFSMDEYDSGIKTVVFSKIVEEKVDEGERLANEAKKIMGGELNLDQFGEKPLRNNIGAGRCSVV